MKQDGTILSISEAGLNFDEILYQLLLAVNKFKLELRILHGGLDKTPTITTKKVLLWRSVCRMFSALKYISLCSLQQGTKLVSLLTFLLHYVFLIVLWK